MLGMRLKLLCSLSFLQGLCYCQVISQTRLIVFSVVFFWACSNLQSCNMEWEYDQFY